MNDPIIHRPPNEFFETRRVRVESNGVFTKVLDADTGEMLPNGMRIRFEHNCWDQSDCLPMLDIDGTVNYRAEVDLEVSAKVYRFGSDPWRWGVYYSLDSQGKLVADQEPRPPSDLSEVPTEALVGELNWRGINVD